MTIKENCDKVFSIFFFFLFLEEQQYHITFSKLNKWGKIFKKS